MNYPVENTKLPAPIVATIFGVKVRLHLPCQVFHHLLLHFRSSTNLHPLSLASLSEWLLNLATPIQFQQILTEAQKQLAKNPSCPQYQDDAIIFLSNAFPQVDPESLVDTLSRFNHDLFLTAIELTKAADHCLPDENSEEIDILNPYASYQISTLLAFDKPFQSTLVFQPILNSQKDQRRAIEQQRKQQEDEDRAFALSIQEQEVVDFTESTARRLQEDEELAKSLQIAFEADQEAEKRRQEEENIVECSCCCTELPFEQMVQCHEGHLTCKQCVQRSIETALSEGQVRTSCPSMDCTSYIPLEELERVLPHNLLQRLDETEAANALSVIDIPGLRTCWKCAYKMIVENPDIPFYCPVCDEATCKSCGKKDHPGRTCDQADIDPNRIVESRMSEAIVKACPKCHLQIIKDEGCNHMTCPKCRTEFCYLCGANITGNVSEHYKTCSQFQDNAAYQRQQIDQAREKALKDMELRF